MIDPNAAAIKHGSDMCLHWGEGSYARLIFAPIRSPFVSTSRASWRNPKDMTWTDLGLPSAAVAHGKRLPDSGPNYSHLSMSGLPLHGAPTPVDGTAFFPVSPEGAAAAISNRHMLPDA